MTRLFRIFLTKSVFFVFYNRAEFLSRHLFATTTKCPPFTLHTHSESVCVRGGGEGFLKHNFKLIFLLCCWTKHKINFFLDGKCLDFRNCRVPLISNFFLYFRSFPRLSDSSTLWTGGKLSFFYYALRYIWGQHKT